MPADDLFQAVRYIREGNFSLVVSGAVKRLTERQLDGVRIVSVSDTAAQVRDAGKVSLVRDPDDETQFFPVFADRTVGVDRNEPFDRIDFVLAYPDSVEIMTVDVTFTGEDGNEWKRTLSITNEDYLGSWSHVAYTLELNRSATQATISLKTSGSIVASWKSRLINRLWESDSIVGELPATYQTRDRPRLGPPLTSARDDQPPVVLITLDSLRFDEREHLQPLVNELGDDLIFPDSPRTQGYWTGPSHACMLTGAHPGTHGYVGWSDGVSRPIDPDIKTLGEILHHEGYKCSGIVSHGRLLPQFGFGRGFQRYKLNNMNDFVQRDDDARKTIRDFIQWVEADAGADGPPPFYFMHLYDPHFPYVPPLPATDCDELDLAAVEEFMSNFMGPYNDRPDSNDPFNPKPRVAPEVVDLIRQYYRSSIGYTAEQVARFIRTLKTHGLFEDALVIVTGDHGESFGETGYFGHTSLYDANIRPFMAVKPPADADWEVPDVVDTIDFLPTVAELVGTEIPEQCQGTAMQREERTEPRFVERLEQSWYNLAVEHEGRKAIFTYRINYPNRPTDNQLETGPVHVEYHEVADVKAGDYSGTSFSDRRERELEELAVEFVQTSFNIDGSHDDGFVMETDQESREQLEYLGYL